MILLKFILKTGCNRGEAEAVPCQKKGRTGGGAPGRQKVERQSTTAERR